MRVTLKNFIIPSIPLAVFLVGSCSVLWMSSYFGSHLMSSSNQVSSGVISFRSLFLPNILLENIICLALTLLNAFLIAQINNRFTVIRTRTFLPILIFLILMATWNQTHIAVSSHLAVTLFIFAIFYFFSMSRDRKASEQAFMGTFLISISSILINQLAFLIPVCWIGFIIFQSFSLRTFLASVFGALTPWILFLSASYLINPDVNFNQFFILNLNFQSNFSAFSIAEMVYSAGISVIMIISILGMNSISNSDAIITRNILNFLIFLLISLTVLSFIFQNQFILFLPFIAMIYAMLISHPLTLKQSNFYGILFVVFCILNLAFIISKYIPILK